MISLVFKKLMEKVVKQQDATKFKLHIYPYLKSHKHATFVDEGMNR